MSGPEQPGSPTQPSLIQPPPTQPSPGWNSATPPPPTPPGPANRAATGSDLRHVAIGAGAGVLVLIVAGVAFAAGQLGVFGPTQRQGAPGPGVERPIPGGPADQRRGPGRGLLGPIAPRLPSDRGLGTPGGLLGLRQITISAINGSSVTVGTVDGWTRTFTVTDATTITRAGQTIALTDLKVGDQIRFQQQRNADGTFAVTAVEVVLPRVAGQVTATTSDAITIQRADGTTMTIHVGSDTKYQVRGVQNATLADISVGMLIVAQGTQNTDGSLQAVAIDAAARR